jgi:hypothetical protein
MTVTKRLITTPERHAATVATIAARVAERWPKVEAVAAALTPPTLRAATSRDGGRNSDHPDPTANIALGHQDYDDLREAVSAWLEQGKWIEQQQIGYLKDHPETHAAKTDALKTLCVYPGCDFDKIAARGLCWYHYRNTPQDADQANHAPSKPNVLERGTIQASASPRVEATCGRCGRTFPARDSEHARLLLDDHHATGCPNRTHRGDGSQSHHPPSL